MNLYLSGMSRQTTRLPFRCRRNRAASRVRCARSMTKTISAQSSTSPLTGSSAESWSPADAHSTPGHCEKTCSAVGLRRRFCAQTKSTRGTSADGRQVDAEAAAGAVCRQANSLAAVAPDDLAHQGEAEARAAAGLAAARQAMERLEDALALVGRHTRPVVAHLQD